MNIEEQFEEIKRKVLSRLQSSEGMPSEINQILEQFKDALISKATQEKVNFSSVLEYIEGQFEVFKRSKLARIGESRKDKKIEDIMYDITLAKEKLEENINNAILQERKKEDGKEANNTTSKILGELQYLLEDINSRYRRILSSRGFEENTINDMSYDFKLFAKYYMQSRCERQMVEAFQNDNNNLREFEQSILNEIINLGDKKINEENGFRVTLKNQAPTLQEQREDAIKRNSTQSAQGNVDQTRVLPNDILK